MSVNNSFSLFFSGDVSSASSLTSDFFVLEDEVAKLENHYDDEIKGLPAKDQEMFKRHLRFLVSGLQSKIKAMQQSRRAFQYIRAELDREIAHFHQSARDYLANCQSYEQGKIHITQRSQALESKIASSTVDFSAFVSRKKETRDNAVWGSERVYALGATAILEQPFVQESIEIFKEAGRTFVTRPKGHPDAPGYWDRDVQLAKIVGTRAGLTALKTMLLPFELVVDGVVIGARAMNERHPAILKSVKRVAKMGPVDQIRKIVLDPTKKVFHSLQTWYHDRVNIQVAHHQSLGISPKLTRHYYADLTRIAATTGMVAVGHVVLSKLLKNNNIWYVKPHGAEEFTPVLRPRFESNPFKHDEIVSVFQVKGEWWYLHGKSKKIWQGPSPYQTQPESALFGAQGGSVASQRLIGTTQKVLFQERSLSLIGQPVEFMTSSKEQFYRQFKKHGKNFSPIPLSEVPPYKDVYFYTTVLRNALSILRTRSVKRFDKEFFRGVFVSTKLEKVYGDVTFVFNRNIENRSKVLNAEFLKDSHWTGFSRAIPVNRKTLEYIAVSETILEKWPIEILAQEISKIANRKILIVPMKQIDKLAKHRLKRDGVFVPEEWPLEMECEVPPHLRQIKIVVRGEEMELTKFLFENSNIFSASPSELVPNARSNTSASNDLEPVGTSIALSKEDYRMYERLFGYMSKEFSMHNLEKMLTALGVEIKSSGCFYYLTINHARQQLADIGCNTLAFSGVQKLRRFLLENGRSPSKVREEGMTTYFSAAPLNEHHRTLEMVFNGEEDALPSHVVVQMLHQLPLEVKQSSARGISLIDGSKKILRNLRGDIFDANTLANIREFLGELGLTPEKVIPDYVRQYDYL